MARGIRAPPGICSSLKNTSPFLLFSSPEQKAHKWAYSIGRHPSSIRQRFQMTSPLKPWSQLLPNLIYSIYRPGEWINMFFCSNWIRTLVAMVSYSCHWLIMGKVEIGIYCYLTADTLTKKCSLSSPLPTIWILSKRLNLFGCYGNQKAKFAKKYSKTISSESLRGLKLKLCRNVHNISLYKTFFILLPLLMCFHCYGNLKFP